MGCKLYVGNLPYSVRDEDLGQVFNQFGVVASAKVMMERDTGRSKGFGFVELSSEAEAQAAIEAMNGQPLGGRSLVVNVARPIEPRAPRFNNAGGGGGYGGGYGAPRPAQFENGYAGRNEGSFRSPYGTGPRGRGGYDAGNGGGGGGGGRYRDGE